MGPSIIHETLRNVAEIRHIFGEILLHYLMNTQGGKGSSEGKKVQPILLHDFASGTKLPKMK